MSNRYHLFVKINEMFLLRYAFYLVGHFVLSIEPHCIWQ